MSLQNPPKAMIVLVALLCITVLLIARVIDPEAGLGLIGLIVGYGIGNGIAAKNGEDVQPIIGTTRRDRRAGERHITPE